MLCALHPRRWTLLSESLRALPGETTLSPLSPMMRAGWRGRGVYWVGRLSLHAVFLVDVTFDARSLGRCARVSWLDRLISDGYNGRKQDFPLGTRQNHRSISVTRPRVSGLRLIDKLLNYGDSCFSLLFCHWPNLLHSMSSFETLEDS